MAIEILVVDDEPDLAILIRQKFRKRIRSDNWHFHFAHNGVEALKTLETHSHIALVLTDINMPEMDGLTLLDHLSKFSHPIKAIVVSAYGDMSNIRIAMNRGAFDFITKPVDFEDLEITVEKTLREVIAYREAVDSQTQLALLQKELSVAKRIQEAFIPADTLEHSSFEVAALLDTAKEVGGDFYDFFMLDDHRLAVAIGDVAGKGISAAIFMAITRTLLRAIAQKGVSPGDCLTEVNELLYPQSLAEMFVTAVYGTLDISTGLFTYATAGHFAPYLIRADNTLRALERTYGIGLCMTRDFHYREAATQLSTGDTLFFYTDGISEAVGKDGQQFSLESLEDTLLSTQGSTPFHTIQKVLGALQNHTKGVLQTDDITLIALSFRGD